jgi:hypothetical protein
MFGSIVLMMGYRRLLKSYIAHVTAHSGDSWLYIDDEFCSLSHRDLVELRAIFDEFRSQDRSDPQVQNFNAATRDICEQQSIDAAKASKILAWPQRLVERWLLDPSHPEYKRMSSRDFDHFTSCVLPTSGQPRPNDPSAR